jgi:hypothetical protein
MKNKKYLVGVDVEVQSDNDVSMAEVQVDMIGNNFRTPLYFRRFGGSARRNPVDKANRDAGAMIALGRALEQAGKQLQAAGDGLVKEDADMKIHRANAKPKPKGSAKYTRKK